MAYLPYGNVDLHTLIYPLPQNKLKRRMLAIIRFLIFESFETDIWPKPMISFVSTNVSFLRVLRIGYKQQSEEFVSK